MGHQSRERKPPAKIAMLYPLVILWLAAPPALPEHRADITHWALARGFQAVAPAAGKDQAAYEARVAEELEAELEQVRVTAPSTPGAFERVDELLSQHPELPQAAWLMAERYALEAQFKGGDLQRAALQAQSLEGRRAPAFGASPAEQPADPGPARAYHLSGARPRDQVFIDGVQRAGGASLAPGSAHSSVAALGLHHVQLFRGGTYVWAGWVEVGPSSELRVEDPTLACSDVDLAGVALGPEAALPPPGVLCSRWAVARPGAIGGTDIALCHGARCAPWEHQGSLGVATGGAAAGGGEAAPTSGAGLPPWLTWTAAAAGAAAAAGIILWQSGAFSRPEPSTEFVFTGPTAGALQF